MGRTRFRFHSLCIGHVTPCVRTCTAYSLRTKSSSSDSIKYENISEYSSHDDSGSRDNGDKGSAENGNKVMVVVDSTFEGKGALEWALSHTVQTHDTVILVHVAKPTREGGESPRKFNLKASLIRKACVKRRNLGCK
ncbi:putative rossmann-like alpha/beta/alpha sandwich protein [Lupinus albus]|uniref:Putative rossmann-like alpha/beta/alpha sandwich protein n=1 Tax=Lupinus albus TaxID=3870 RepID=A0A6A4PL27_LUPAL|nr:putative rossmann-like alpha/beta/alpha sandwich protein [Lupinus albus]